MKIDEVRRNAFYQFPQWLLDEEYRDLSLRAKIMYMLIFDRRSLSIKNNWHDENGDIFVYFTNKEFMKVLNCSEPVVVAGKKDLSDFGLLREVRQGVNIPNKLYISGTKENLGQDLKKVKHGTKENLGQDLKKVKPIKTDNINTNLSRLIEPEGGSDNTLFSEKGTPAPSPLKIFNDLWVGESGQQLTPLMIEQAQDMLEEHNIEVVKLAVLECVNQGKMYFAYLKSILDNWKRERLTTAELVKNRQKPKRQQEYDPVGNIPEWSNMHPKNANKPKKKRFDPEGIKKWLEEEDGQ